MDRRKKVDYEGRGKYKRVTVSPVGSIVTFQQTTESFAATKCLLQRFKKVQIRGRKLTVSDVVRFALAWVAGVYDEYQHETKGAIGETQVSETGQAPGLGIQEEPARAD